MRNVWLVRTLVTALVLLLAGWVVHKTSWVEVDVRDPASGAAADDRYYALRAVLQAAGATLSTPTTLEPLPPPGATLVLESSLWNIFPERDARQRAWVEQGGQLVVLGWQMGGDTLRWIPLSFAVPQSPRAASAAAASAPMRVVRQPPPADAVHGFLPGLQRPRDCHVYTESSDTVAPAFDPGRSYRGCVTGGWLRPLHVTPAWTLTGAHGTLAMRVPLGRGSVTGLTAPLPMDNAALLDADDALIVAAVMQAAPGRAVWVVDDERRAPLAAWLWQHARAPVLLAFAAVALALWRLLVRFGPREAPPAVARRSMGEQVRGTGVFLASTDPAALHAATREAWASAVRARIEHATDLDDRATVAAVERRLAPRVRLDAAALLAALHPAPPSTRAQWLAAIAVVEQARRALLAAPAAPPA